MPKTKFGVGDDVSSESTFAPYEGPLPKPGTVYPVELKSASIRKAGDRAKNPGAPYIKTLWEITEGECKGYPAWYNVVPGEHEIMQKKVAQFMQAVCKKNSADIVHDDVDEGGKISKIGGRNPVGVKAGMSFERKKDPYGVPEGEEAPWKAETTDLFPGWVPKQRSTEDEDAEDEDVAEDDEDFEDEDAEDVEEADEDEDEDEDEEAEEDEQVSHDEASKMTLADLKKLATEWESELDLSKFKGPKGKKALLQALIDEEIVEDPNGGDEPPF